MPDNEYDVYLVPTGKRGGEQNIVSPVEGDDLEFYETGVWLRRKGGRNFFPYEQIRTIREHGQDVESSKVAGEESGESAGD
ncbi:hypothetical protein [Haladaptatus sp. DYF46]|uniref:hypothetical protein n=1 Tax=Haladaptatus sp. DYF46 TaxID=2886041 RepID=UPI001E5779B8|nr:hypothetical protein [Haladaptatus sp. DYF46]